MPSPPAAVERTHARVDVALQTVEGVRVAGATVRRITEHLPPDGDLDAVVTNTRDPAAQQSNAIGFVDHTGMHDARGLEMTVLQGRCV